jgi:heterodisulfide reductase subunit A
MSSARSIVAVLCDQQCSPRGPLAAAELEKRLSEKSDIKKIIVLEKACQDPEKKLKRLEGKKVLFGGCPYLEETGFYKQAAEKLGLGPGEMLVLDVKSSVMDFYDTPEGVTENLAGKLEAMGSLLASSQAIGESPLQPKPAVLVYGSGLSGLLAALELAGEKLSVDLVETADRPLAPGCLAERLHDPGRIRRLSERAAQNENIIVLAGERISRVEAREAGFAVTFEDGRLREYGAVLFAPERIEEPSGEIGAWNLTQLYDRLADRETIKGKIVFLLDRHGETPAEILQDVLAAARVLKERSRAEIWILAKQVRVSLPGLQELYDSCRQSGIIFVKYDSLSVGNEYGDFEIGGRDPQSGATFRISKPDRVVLPGKTGLSGAAVEAAGKLGLRLLDGCYSQPESLWRLTNESNRPGVLVCGSARANMDAAGVAGDAAAAVLAMNERLFSRGILPVEHLAVVDADKCAYCLTCLRVCPFAAVARDSEQRVAKIIAAACQGCGICAAECPAEAISLRNLERESILAGVQALASP